MKKTFTLKLIQTVFVLILFAGTSYSQLAKTFLDINDVKAVYFSDGGLFWDMTGSTNAVYFVPKNEIPQKATIFSSSIMIGGVDQGGVLHTAGMTYRQRGLDFWPGPLNVTTGEAHEPENWNRIWSVKKSDIDFHRANYQTPNYVVPQDILDWPGNGPVGCSPILAPFFDKDGDGLYEPIEGDYPKIKGDQAVYFIFNDNKGKHTQYPGGEPLKVEVHGMAWAKISTNPFLNQATFVSYSVFNRSTTDYYDVKVSQFSDYDIGNPDDDYMATDTLRNLVYCYNADENDGNGVVPGYGLNPPAQGMVYLNRVLKTSIGFTNQSVPGVNGDPRDAIELNRYMSGYWADGQYIAYGTANGRGSGERTNYIFSGDVCLQEGWREIGVPGDRRMMSMFKIDTFKAGTGFNYDVAFVYARGDSGVKSSVCKLQEATDYLLNEYNSGALTGVSDERIKEIKVFPNPVTNISKITLENPYEKFKLLIYDTQGRILKDIDDIQSEVEIDAKDFVKGVYFIQLKSHDNLYYAKFIVN